MKLKELMDSLTYELIKGSLEQEISGIVYDSRKVQEGSLFVCLKGFQSDGHAYIGKAVEAGAAAVIVEDADACVPYDTTAVKVEDAREALALVSVKWFGNPAKDMTMIGLTGTKGKTTTAHMIKKILEEAGHRVGMIGTLGAYIGEEKIPTRNTTPESYELHSLFATMKEKGCTHVVMEVSSQGLKQKRTAGILFDYGVFLNLSVDHISDGEHADFEEYKACKKLLFNQTKQPIINLDNEYSREFLELTENPFTISCKEDADLKAVNIRNLWDDEILGIAFTVEGKVQGDITVSMPGIFNAENAMVAIAIAAFCGIKVEDMNKALRKVSVKGRTQLIRETAHFATFIIDYAHNELSMESLLHMLKGYEPKRLICLFGGGGNKPKQRRYDMGKIAGKYADLTILTTDNPRFEEVEDINNQIIEGLNVYNGKYEFILDRQKAIEHLLDTAKKGDIVALIGKGHEDYQEIKGVKYYFCEEEIILNHLKQK